MEKRWLLIAAVVLMVAVAGCIGGNGTEGADGNDTADGTNGSDPGGNMDDESGADTAELTSCETGETYTETYRSPSSSDGEAEEGTVTMSVEGTESRDTTEYCVFAADYSEANMGLNQTFGSNPELEDRVASEVRWLVPTDQLDDGFNTTGQDVIMEIYDSNGNIMMSFDMDSEEGMMGMGMKMYDEDGNEIEMGMGGVGGGGSQEMPEGF